MIKTKILVLLASIATFGLYLIGKHAVALDLCAETDYGCRSNYDYFEGVMYFSKTFVFVAVCSLFLKQKYYSAWWRFARFALPTGIFCLILINIGVLHQDLSTGSGFGWAGILDNFLDKVATLTIYIFFVVGSVVTIFRCQRKNKKSNAK